MQEPAGYVMSHVGGDVVRHGDGNRWTDNLVGEPGGQVATIDPRPGGSAAQVTVVGTQDDRVIQTKPLDRLGQHTFCIAEATMARLTRQSDPGLLGPVPDRRIALPGLVHRLGIRRDRRRVRRRPSGPRSRFTGPPARASSGTWPRIRCDGWRRFR